MEGETPETGPAGQVRLLLIGMLTLAVLAGASLYLARGIVSPGPAFDATAPPAAASPLAAARTAAAVAIVGKPAVVIVRAGPAGAACHARGRPGHHHRHREPQPRPAHRVCG